MAQLNGMPTTEERAGQAAVAHSFSPRAQDGSLVCIENSRTVRDTRRNLSLEKQKGKERKEGRTSADRDVGKGNSSLYSAVET